MLNLKLIIPKFSLLLHNTLYYFLKILTFCSKSKKIESFSLLFEQDAKNIKEMNIINAYKKLGNDKYDVILCNPPYYDKVSTNKNIVKNL